jgi:hypothetical protein
MVSSRTKKRPARNMPGKDLGAPAS